MKKIKLLITAFALLGASQTWAQTDVTSMYLTNADFEGEATSQTKPQDNRDIYKPDGWTVTYTNGNENDITSLSSDYTQWNNFSSKPQPATGSKAYWMRFRWGNSENITLTQETTSALPAGTYALSVDAYSDDNTGTATISVAGLSKTVGVNSAWGNYKIVFTLASAQTVTVSLSYTNTATDDHAVAFDNVKLLELNEEPTGITLRNTLGGTAADLADFNVWYDDYTLEVEGTEGTEITVAADNISYTPEATGTVRFVKKDGIVYVYEGTSYKGAVNSSKADYVYTRTLSESAPTTDNYLENPSFETLGSSVGTNIWNIGTPWTSNVTMKSGGIRVGLNGSKHVLVWRGSGNNNYFSQEISSLPKYKGYKIFLQQVASGNANANFNVGLGNAAGDYSYLSTLVKLGTGQDGTKNAILGVNEKMPTTGVFFSFKNTSSNSSSSGNDPVTQIDWIGLVGSDDFPITGASSASYVYGAAYAPATAKSSYLAAKAEAETTIADATYTNVTGSERTTLQTAINADVADNDEAYDTATQAIQDAKDAFIAALSHYQALIDAQAAVPDLAYASAEKKAFITALATSADDADTKLAAMTTNIRALYESHALAEGVVGAVDKTSLLTNPNNPTNTTGWTVKNTVGDSKMRIMTNEPYTNADGTTASGYFDTNSWGTAFSTTFTQNVELPAGTYILTAKARGNGTTTYQVVADGQTTDISSIGNTGGVFGRGWNDYTVEFTLAAKKTVTLGINIVTGSSGNWLSFGNFRLVRIAFDAATATEYNALNDAITAKEGNTLGFETGQYAPYNNVGVLTAIANAKAIDQEGENAKADVEALTTALTSATWTANDSDVDAIYNGNFAENLTGWTRTNGWGQQQTGLEGDYATAYYNQPGSLKYGDTGFYTMPLAENTIYKFTMAFRSHEANSNNAMNVSILNENSEGLAKVNLGYNKSKDNWKTVTIRIKTGAAGNYVANLENDGNTWMTGVSLVKDNQAADITIDEAAESKAVADPLANVTLTRTLSKDYWNTFSVPFNAEIPDGWTVMEFKSAENNVISFSKASSLEAGKPYLVKPENDVTNPVFENVVVESIDGQTVGEGDYKFVAQIYNKSLATDGTVAYLATDGKVKKLTSGGIKGLRAYFTIPANVPEARIAFIDFDGDTTGISEKTMKVNEGIIYDLNGRRVENMGKGIYVVNGKKIVK